MTPKERLDETIDRVAAELTLVPSDPALVEKVRARIAQDASAFPFWRFAVAGAALAAVTLLAVVTWFGDTTTIPAPAPAVATSTGPQAAEPAHSTATPAAPSVASAAPARRPDNRLITHQQVVQQITALTIEPLTIAPVELAPLDVANLVLGESDSPEEPKE